MGHGRVRIGVENLTDVKMEYKRRKKVSVVDTSSATSIGPGMLVWNERDLERRRKEDLHE
jgi:hypothetical protein